MIKELINRYKEAISYLFFGVLTTIVNLISYKFFTILQVDLYVSVVLAWILSVVFAFITNKLFVFESKSWEMAILGKELVLFLSARILSLGIDLVAMGVMVNIIHIQDMIAKLVANVIVVIVNYIFSKFLIFKK